MTDLELEAEPKESEVSRDIIPGAYTCPACGHQAIPDAPIGADIIRCTTCQSVIAFGVPMPQVIVQPDATDNRFILVTFYTNQNGQKAAATYKLVRGFAKAIGVNILSICP